MSIISNLDNQYKYYVVSPMLYRTDLSMKKIEFVDNITQTNNILWKPIQNDQLFETQRMITRDGAQITQAEVIEIWKNFQNMNNN